MTHTETLTWLPADAQKPTDNRTLLCWGTEGFFTGYWDAPDSCWIGCESGGTVLGVTHFAEPRGPGAGAPAAPHVKSAAEIRADAAHDNSCVGAFARSRPGATA